MPFSTVHFSTPSILLEGLWVHFPLVLFLSPVGVFPFFALLNEWVWGPIFQLPNLPTPFHRHDIQRRVLSLPT